MALRILLVGPTLQYPWLEYTARALTRLGHTIKPFRYNTMMVNRASSPVVARKLAWLPLASQGLAQYLRAWRAARDQALIEVTRQMRPDLILVLKGQTVSHEALARIKDLARGPLVTWWVDDPWLYPDFVPCLPLFEHVFMFDRSYLPKLAAAGVARGHFLPCACDETVYQPRVLTRWEQQRYRCDIALVAWYYANRVEVVQALREFDLHIWGRQWTTMEARRSFNGDGRRMIRGSRFINDEQVAKIYSAAAIGLNIHSPQSHQAGLNTRTFELLASGTFQMVDAIPGMVELLAPGKEVVAYHSAEEARDLARYYLAHPSERARIAERGRARTLREHTYVHRMRTILRTVTQDDGCHDS